MKIKILDDLVDAGTEKLICAKGDIVECDMVMTVRKSGEKNYVINGYVISEDVVEVLENEKN